MLPVLGLLALVLVRGRRHRVDPDTLAADPEDRPLPAVVVNPTKIEPGDRHRIESVCTGLGWAEPLWLETTVEDPGTGRRSSRSRRAPTSCSPVAVTAR